MTTKALPKSKAKTAYGLLSEVRRLILAEPKRYDQTTYVARVGGAGRSADLDAIGLKRPDCGTVGCVAGWVATLKAERAFASELTGLVAANILGLDQEQRGELFRGNALGNIKASKQTKRYAVAGAAHIAKFQEKHAKQLKAKAV